MGIMQLATAGAAVLVAEMAKSGWSSFREGVKRFFRRGGEESAEQELRLIDSAQTRLTESPEAERSAVVGALKQELMIQLAAFLQKNPEAAKELQALVDASDHSGTRGGAQADVRGNTSTQVVIGGRDATAGDFSYGVPEGEK
ncbi:hypothetical protein ACIBI4_13910 [Streptomyces sp. NPDC050418]|uniref:hypothetical protein n=1 Tax=Streptomyces sp. NPDC050418 TaxID=3365612 RepID=UPI003787B4EE